MADVLAVDDLSAGYGAAVVLRGLSLRLAEGRSLAVLGRNGMGKTTLLNTIVGVTRRFGGAIRLSGRDITALPPERRARAGIGWVPQERNIFRSLSVEENLTAVARPGPWTPEAVYGMFPRLRERRGNMGDQLSGGEQQMLAVGRALVLNPRLLLLDEPTEGLAPIIVDELLAALRRITRDEGMSALVVEQHAHKILGVTDEAVILERGAVVHAASSAALRADPAVLERHLGVSRRGAAAGPSTRRSEALAMTTEPRNADAAIDGYHAHVYYDPAATRDRAERVRAWIGERFPEAQLGRWHDVPVGPHPRAMFQIAFPAGLFPALVPWLMLNRLGLAVLVHPNTEDARADHLVHALWMGEILPLDADVLPPSLRA